MEPTNSCLEGLKKPMNFFNHASTNKVSRHTAELTRLSYFTQYKIGAMYLKC